ncbi:hypothetical protein GIB67_000506 [Kingdonia uniflora]|uniref:Mon2/Sec7/BIG1-like HUS domain-containing protein n=1 Tax=Kingdonia uniflora TaxID=39325 RepID=A0A7J7L0L4_9MAGN|nr:hypothetical protein GIB67_000506 [Kingdonia uniflora]
MGRPKMDSEINAIEEEPKEFDSTSNIGALACMINYEVGALLAIMRRNVRWGGRFMAGDDQLEHSLIYSLKLLQKQIFSWPQQWSTVNPVLYLQQFLDVVRSDETSALITGVILSLLYKILTLNVIDLNTVTVEETMHLVVDVVRSCRFEVTDPASEEVVLMKILQVLLACMKSKAAIVLSNQHVRDYCFGSSQLDNGNSFVEYNGQRPSVGIASSASMGNMMNGTIGVSPNDLQLMTKPHGASYQQQKVTMEALVDFYRQKASIVEMYVNLDCDITCNNVFEDLSNLLSKSAFPVSGTLFTMHILALDGLITVIEGMAERIGSGSAISE